MHQGDRGYLHSEIAANPVQGSSTVTGSHEGEGGAWRLRGTNILGGRGHYLGTLVGVVLIVLLNSVLSIMEMPEAGRQVIYGLVIILMLLVYGRSERVTS